MPLAGINGIIIDLMRRTEGYSAVGAAHKHHVGCVSARRPHTGQHINVVVGRPTGAIDRQEQHSIQTCRIYPTTREVAAHIDVLGYLVKSRCLASDLRIARANTGKAVKAVPFSADKEIAVRVHVERPVCGRIVQRRNGDGSLPRHPAVRGALEFHDARVIAVNPIACLVLESVTRAVRLINREPLFIAAFCEAVRLKLCPGLTAVS